MTRAAVLEAPRRLEVAERPKPLPGPGEAVVRVAATAGCHTDLAIYTGRHPGVRYPVVLGHEAAGIVEAGGAPPPVGGGGRGGVNPLIARGARGCCPRGGEKPCRPAGR